MESSSASRVVSTTTLPALDADAVLGGGVDEPLDRGEAVLQPMELRGGFLAIAGDLGADVVLGVDHLLAPDAEAIDHDGETGEGGGGREELGAALGGRDGLERADPEGEGKDQDSHGTSVE